MANDNPLINFFSSMAAGAEAGRERKTLLQRAQRGEVSMDEVPGRAATILQGIGRATMTPNERANQDQIKMQMANYALQNSIREKSAMAQLQKNVIEQAKIQRELDQELADRKFVAETSSIIQDGFHDEDLSKIRNIERPLNVSSKAWAEVRDMQKDALGSVRGKMIDEHINRGLQMRQFNPDAEVPNDFRGRELAYNNMFEAEERKTQAKVLSPILDRPDVSGASAPIPGAGTIYFSKKQAQGITSKVNGMSTSAMENELRDLRIKLADSSLLDQGRRNELEFQKKTIEQRLIQLGSTDPIIDQEAPLSLYEKYQLQNR